MARIKSIDGRIRDEVLRLNRKGWSAQDIAERLGVSPQTIYYHLHAAENEGESIVLRTYAPRS